MTKSVKLKKAFKAISLLSTMLAIGMLMTEVSASDDRWRTVGEKGKPSKNNNISIQNISQHSLEVRVLSTLITLARTNQTSTNNLNNHAFYVHGNDNLARWITGEVGGHNNVHSAFNSRQNVNNTLQRMTLQNVNTYHLELDNRSIVITNHPSNTFLGWAVRYHDLQGIPDPVITIFNNNTYGSHTLGYVIGLSTQVRNVVRDIINRQFPDNIRVQITSQQSENAALTVIANYLVNQINGFGQVPYIITAYLVPEY